MNRAEPAIATVSDLWPTAEWHERDVFDLFGVRFNGHQDLRRILLDDSWVGHPLRKDYEFPTRYEGIPDPAAQAAETGDSAEGSKST